MSSLFSFKVNRKGQFQLHFKIIYFSAYDQEKTEKYLKRVNIIFTVIIYPLPYILRFENIR